MKILFRIFIGILLLLAIVIGASSLLLPKFVSEQVESKIHEQLNPGAQAVRVESSPGAKLLMGEVDAFRGTLEDVKLGKLNMSNFVFDLANMKISPMELIMNRKVEMTSLGTGEMKGTITQKDLQDFMEGSVKGLEVDQVEIGSNGINLSGTINIGGFLSGKVTVQGELEIKGNALQFTAQKFSINGSSISGLNSAVLKSISIYDFAEFPIPVKAQRVEMEKGEVHIFVEPIAK